MTALYSPDELRAQVARVRALAWKIAEEAEFSLQSGIACGMLEAAANQLEELMAEEESNYQLVARQGLLLTTVVNALRGEPPPDTLWSHHDAGILAQAAAQELTRLGGIENFRAQHAHD